MGVEPSGKNLNIIFFNNIDILREYLKNLLWLRSSFGNRNPGQVAMVSIRNLVAIQGCDPNRNLDCNQGILVEVKSRSTIPKNDR